jgi:hypothetical protein
VIRRFATVSSKFLRFRCWTQTLMRHVAIAMRSERRRKRRRLYPGQARWMRTPAGTVIASRPRRAPRCFNYGLQGYCSTDSILSKFFFTRSMLLGY